MLLAGYSLAQPHLERTRLCEMKDSELDPKYVAQREGLRKLVQVGGRAQGVWSWPEPLA